MLAQAATFWVHRLLVQAGRPELMTLDPLLFVAMVSAVTVGPVPASRRPAHPVGWLLLALAVFIGATELAAAYGPYGLLVRPGALPAARSLAVSNAGAAAGFPFLPVDRHHLAPVADQLIGRLHPDRLRLLLALACQDHTLLGWVALARRPSRLVGHWATVQHLQTHPSHRGRGVGSALMRAACTTSPGRSWGWSSCTWLFVAAWAWRGSTLALAGVRSAVGQGRCAWPQATIVTRS